MKVNFDYILFFAVLLLVVLGLLFVCSASMYSAEVNYGNKYFFLGKQAVGALIGLAAMVSLTFVKLDLIKRFWIVGVVVSIVLLALVFVPGIGVENYGARRWIGFGSFTIQPSEIAKFAYVLFCAVYMSKRDLSKLKNCIWPVIVGGVFCLLIIAEPNMSITMCVAMLMVIMLFIGGMKSKNFLLLLVPLCIAVPLLIIAEPYRLQRLLAFVDPWASPKGEGYQLIQSLYALGSGGWFGVGLFNSRQKYRFLPFAESDFILSVIGEEIGLIGCMMVFALYLLIILRAVRIATNCTDKFSCFLASGICAVIAVQSLLNFAVVTGSIPPTGLPLPFVSYGGTSLVVFMGAVGILLNISRQVLQNVGVKRWIT